MEIKRDSFSLSLNAVTLMLLMPLLVVNGVMFQKEGLLLLARMQLLQVRIHLLLIAL